MITARNITKHFGAQVLFENASFSLGPGERFGLVGRNGSGKTTLFMMITGEESCDTGEIVAPKEYRIGHLDQTLHWQESTILEEGCRGLSPEEKDDTWKVKKILSGLGFSEDDFTRSPAEFSGGYQMRIALARLLVSGPDLLLLDEPTNFLDILSIRWLTDFLRSWPGELMIVSHDRAFMDNIITHTMGIHRQAIRIIGGSTERYYRQILAEEDVHERRRINDEKIRKKEEAFINRFRAKARRASQVQSRIKRLEKRGLTDRLTSLENLDFSFNYSPCPGKIVLAADRISFSYSGRPPYLIDSFSFTLEAADKIGIIGQNGSGKTTLLRLLAGKLTPLAGETKRHPRAETACFDPAAAGELHPERTIEEEILSSLSVGDRGRARSICGAMLFSQDTALKRIAVLSGGEKCRVMLGKVIGAPANLLMLDEPTHHLDMESCRAMILALKRFEGAAVIVSHDEYLLREVATKLIVLQGGEVRLFLGTYDEFLEQIGWTSEESRKKDERADKTVTKKDRRKAKAEQRNLYNKTVGPLKRESERLEKQIAELEAGHARAIRELIAASEKQIVPEIRDRGRDLAELEETIKQSYDDYCRVHDEYEKRLSEMDAD